MKKDKFKFNPMELESHDISEDEDKLINENHRLDDISIEIMSDMRYYIGISDEVNISNVLTYFENELKKTSLIKGQIDVNEEIRKLIGLYKINSILEENGITDSTITLDIEHQSLYFPITGNNIKISDCEIDYRFNDIFDSTLSYLIN